MGISKIRLKFICLIYVLLSMQSCGNKQIEKRNNTESFDKACTPIISGFFQKIKAGQYEEGIKELLMSNPNMNTDDSATINLKNQFKRLNNEAGKFVNFSLLSKRAVNNDLCIYSYLAKYDRRFYRFVFVFYNNDSNIRLYRYSFDSSIDLELEESLKFYSF